MLKILLFIILIVSVIIPVYADSNSTDYIELKWWQLIHTEIKLPHIETLKKIEDERLKIELENIRLKELADKTHRANYTLSEVEEIVLLGNIPTKFPYYKGMDFDVRIVDTEHNPFVKFQSYWDDNMGIDNVIINATVLDPNGVILNEMSGITEKKGKYSSEKTSFSSNYKRDYYSIIVNATQYFDDMETFTTTSLVSYFSLYTPSDNTSKPRCENSNMTMTLNGTCVI